MFYDNTSLDSAIHETRVNHFKHLHLELSSCYLYVGTSAAERPPCSPGLHNACMLPVNIYRFEACADLGVETEKWRNWKQNHITTEQPQQSYVSLFLYVVISPNPVAYFVDTENRKRILEQQRPFHVLPDAHVCYKTWFYICCPSFHGWYWFGCSLHSMSSLSVKAPIPNRICNIMQITHNRPTLHIYT
jgi:hypothetical protein